MARSSVVTRKGQVTIPAEIRRALGLHEGDRVTFVLERGGARIERSGSVIANTRGIFKSERPASDADALRAAAEDAIAADVLERLPRP